MISITINGEKQSNESITRQWIAEQVNNRRHADRAICIIFEIRCGDINVRLPAGDCPPAGNGRPINSFNDRTRQIIKHWEDDGFREKDINTGMVISFWDFLRRNCN